MGAERLVMVVVAVVPLGGDGHALPTFGACVEIVQSTCCLQRIARGHQPPYAVELQPLDRELADGAMRDMGRIERAAEQTDAHAVGMERDRLGDRKRGDRNFTQRGHRKLFSFDAFSSRERAATSLENATEFTAGSVRCRGPGI